MKTKKSQQQNATSTGSRNNVAQSKKKTGTKTALTNITVFRKDIDLGAEDKYGHWWTNLSPAESYGWWPKNPVGLGDTLFGTDGELNGITSFGGSSTKDPHHGDTTGDEYEVFSDGSKTETQIQADMRSFARAYSGEWRWTFGWGQNCHTFQEDMLKKSNLSIKKK
ncbi:hypothetical protein AB9P05_13325 [Roseivirga sp. BDSF3-8]|uniref:hypothetical protein n=1 Tax=Roseivirga sp. BDSF3-8 TaxID=3241598 RepID=UPI003531963B